MRRRPSSHHPLASLSRVLMDPRLQYVLILASALGFAALLFSGFLLFRFNDVNDLLRRGKQQMAEGKIALAAQTFQQLVTKDPDHYEGHIRLGQAFLELGDKGKAEQEFKLATLLKTEANGHGGLKGKMDEVLAAVAMSKLSVARGQYEEAQSRLMLLLKKYPKHAKLREALFELHASWGNQYQNDEAQWPLAIEHYKKALPYAVSYPLEARIKDHLVAIQQQQAQRLLAKDIHSKEAIELLKDTLHYQYSIEMLMQIAELYEKQGDLKEALLWTRKAFETSPDTMSLKYTNLLIRQGRALTDAGKADEARAYFQEAERIGQLANLGLEQLYPVSVTQLTAYPIKPDLEEATFVPALRFLLANQSDKQLEFLVVKAVLYSGEHKICTLIQPVVKPEKPLSAINQGKNRRSIVLEGDKPIHMAWLKHGLMSIRLYVAYSEGDSQQFQLKTLKDVRIKLPDPPPTPEELEAEREKQALLKSKLPSIQTLPTLERETVDRYGNRIPIERRPAEQPREVQTPEEVEPTVTRSVERSVPPPVVSPPSRRPVTEPPATTYKPVKEPERRPPSRPATTTPTPTPPTPTPARSGNTNGNGSAPVPPAAN